MKSEMGKTIEEQQERYLKNKALNELAELYHNSKVFSLEREREFRGFNN